MARRSVLDQFEYDHFNDRWGKRRGPNVPFTTGGTAMFVAGWIGLAIFLVFLYIDRETYSWPTVEGIVRVSEVKDGPQGGVLEFAYDYNVGKRSFRGRRVAQGQDRTLGSYQPDAIDPYEVVRKYPVRTQVTVYHDPAQPLDCLLEPGVTRFTIGGIVISVLLIIVGAVVYLIRPFREADKLEAYEHHVRPFG